MKNTISNARRTMAAVAGPAILLTRNIPMTLVSSLLPTAALRPLATVVAALVGTLLALPAHAGPVTYHGKVGDLDIIVELSDEPVGDGLPIYGRYSYLDKGVDIPLNFVTNSGTDLVLTEESPCSPEECAEGRAPAVGATWTLSTMHPDAHLKGEWAGARSLPVALLRVAKRNRDADEAATPRGLFERSQRFVYAEEFLDARSAPYDELKLNQEVHTRSQEVYSRWRGDLNGAILAFVVDPRTEFDYPRIVALPDGGSPDAANAFLTRRHQERNLAALGCSALQYAGFRESPEEPVTDIGSLGGYEWTTVEVSQLTDKVMSWQEMGSIWCGGSSPSNFVSPAILDIKRARLVDMTEIFESWGADGPGQDIIDLVRELRQKPTDAVSQEHEDECQIDSLIETSLGARITRTEEDYSQVTLGLYDLPTIANACAGDLISFSLKSIRPHLTEEAFELFRP